MTELELIIDEVGISQVKAWKHEAEVRYNVLSPRVPRKTFINRFIRKSYDQYQRMVYADELQKFRGGFER